MGEDSNNKVLTDILERIVRVETKLDVMSDIKNISSTAKELAEQALSSTKSAHYRIDKIDKIVFWVTTTIIGAVILGLLALLFTKG